MHGTTLKRIIPMMPLGTLRQMPQPGQPIANQLLKILHEIGKKVRMRKKQNPRAPDWFLGFKGIMLGLEIKLIELMMALGKQRLITLLPEMHLLGHCHNRDLSGDQFSMNLLKAHHQDIQKNLS